MKLTPDHIYNQSTYFPRLTQDFGKARSLIILQSPFLALKRTEMLADQIKASLDRGVRVCIFARKLFQPTVEELEKHLEAKDRVIAIGAHLNLVSDIHEKLVVIDERILWDGSLNSLSQNRSKERMTRIEDLELVYDAIFRHKLYNCVHCVDKPLAPRRVQQVLGKLINKRRKLLGITMTELAEKSNVPRSTISRIENGRRDFRISTLEKICQELRLNVRTMPLFMLPAIDEVQLANR